MTDKLPPFVFSLNSLERSIIFEFTAPVPRPLADIILSQLNQKLHTEERIWIWDQNTRALMDQTVKMMLMDLKSKGHLYERGHRWIYLHPDLNIEFEAEG